MTQRVAWSQISVGDIVLGAKDGKEWAVTALDGGDVHLEHDGRTAKVALPPGAVVRLATAAEAHERAVAVAQVMLGGEVVARATRPVGEKGHECPATYTQPSALAAHIYLFHGQPDAWGYPGARFGTGRIDVTDERSEMTMAQLVNMHTEMHREMEAGQARKGTVKHWHNPRWDKDGL